ncbi:hypothetical protein ACFYWX_39030 [Streptomyces sp. NPDC002888]|uniref:hypothetical protein n=1 Tax=Streptomyces sp. NPDC002888 TaxID=3364668 RepID=UPI00368103D4
MHARKAVRALTITGLVAATVAGPAAAAKAMDFTQVHYITGDEHLAHVSDCEF